MAIQSGREISVVFPTAVPVLEQFGRDYCCRGNHTLAEACTKHLHQHIRLEITFCFPVLLNKLEYKRDRSTPYFRTGHDCHAD